MELLESLELIGPGRWLDRPVVEQTLKLPADVLQHLASHTLLCHQGLLTLLTRAGLQAEAHHLSTPGSIIGSPYHTASRLAGLWLAELGVILQRWAGHRVHWAEAHVLDAQDNSDATATTIRALFEIEDHSIASETAALALLLLNRALLRASCPGMQKC